MPTRYGFLVHDLEYLHTSRDRECRPRLETVAYRSTHFGVEAVLETLRVDDGLGELGAFLGVRAFLHGSGRCHGEQ